MYYSILIRKEALIKKKDERKRLDTDLKKQKVEIEKQVKELASLKAEKDTALKFLAQADKKLEEATKSNQKLYQR